MYSHLLAHTARSGALWLAIALPLIIRIYSTKVPGGIVVSPPLNFCTAYPANVLWQYPCVSVHVPALCIPDSVV